MAWAWSGFRSAFLTRYSPVIWRATSWESFTTSTSRAPSCDARFEPEQQRVVLGLVVGRLADEVVGPGKLVALLVGDHDADPGGSRVAARAAVDVDDDPCRCVRSSRALVAAWCSGTFPAGGGGGRGSLAGRRPSSRGRGAPPCGGRRSPRRRVVLVVVGHLVEQLVRRAARVSRNRSSGILRHYRGRSSPSPALSGGGGRRRRSPSVRGCRARSSRPAPSRSSSPARRSGSSDSSCPWPRSRTGSRPSDRSTLNWYQDSSQATVSTTSAADALDVTRPRAARPACARARRRCAGARRR